MFSSDILIHDLSCHPSLCVATVGCRYCPGTVLSATVWRDSFSGLAEPVDLNGGLSSHHHVLVLVSVSPGLSEGSDVTQTPSILWSIKGQPAEMDCSHTKGASYYQMYWYRQLPGQGMKQVVFSVPNSKPDYGEFGEVKLSANKTVAERGSFTVKNSSPEDNGMYFCAVSEHSDTDIMCSCTKTPSEFFS